jgi:hypothetical protein
MPRLQNLRSVGHSLGLLLLLLLTQQAAVVHDISHQAHSGTEIAAAAGVERAEAACALCPAYAQVATPAFTHSFQIPVLERSAPERGTAPRHAAIDAAVPRPRSRGPPSL